MNGGSSVSEVIGPGIAPACNDNSVVAVSVAHHQAPPHQQHAVHHHQHQYYHSHHHPHHHHHQHHHALQSVVPSVPQSAEVKTVQPFHNAPVVAVAQPLSDLPNPIPQHHTPANVPQQMSAQTQVCREC